MTQNAIPFLKMHGLGNDFVIIDTRETSVTDREATAKKIGDRHFGIGCDQIIFLEPAEGADIFMRIYNTDGSEAGACGNATRCVADIVMREKRGESCVVQTKARFLNCFRAENNLITVDMGEPRLGWQDIPLVTECDTLYLPLKQPHPATSPLPSPLGGGVGRGDFNSPVAVNMGNPHCVFFVNDVEALDIASLGKPIEHHPLFPERTNVEFVEILDRTHVRMRVWERGSGITLACGSGACATAVACIRRGLTERKITVSMDGGDLTLEWRESDNRVMMTGPVASVFRGVIEA